MVVVKVVDQDVADKVNTVYRGAICQPPKHRHHLHVF